MDGSSDPNRAPQHTKRPAGELPAGRCVRFGSAEGLQSGLELGVVGLGQLVVVEEGRVILGQDRKSVV